jgi:hypothetical protein
LCILFPKLALGTGAMSCTFPDFWRADHFFPAFFRCDAASHHNSFLNWSCFSSGLLRPKSGGSQEIGSGHEAVDGRKHDHPHPLHGGVRRNGQVTGHSTPWGVNVMITIWPNLNPRLMDKISSDENDGQIF